MGLYLDLIPGCSNNANKAITIEAGFFDTAQLTSEITVFANANTTQELFAPAFRANLYNLPDIFYKEFSIDYLVLDYVFLEDRPPLQPCLSFPGFGRKRIGFTN